MLKQHTHQHQYPVAWSTLAPFPLPKPIVKLLDRLQRRRNGGQKTFHVFVQNLANGLVGLPVEIVLLVASCLSPADRLLLSLSAKRLRVILMDHFDLSLKNKQQKLEFLQALEKGWPDRLICRHCARMFDWRLRESSRYTCPRCRSLPSGPPAMLYPEVVCHPHEVCVDEPTLSLILRANLYGPCYGISPSFYDHQCDDFSQNRMYCTRRQVEGRIVNGRFCLARSYTFVHNVFDPQMLVNRHDDYSICIHLSLEIWLKVNMDLRGWGDRRVLCAQCLVKMQCEFCATDVKVMMSPLPMEGMVRIEINWWQEYGELLPCQRYIPTISIRNRNPRGSDDVTRRDLEHEYNLSKSIDDLENGGKR